MDEKKVTEMAARTLARFDSLNLTVGDLEELAESIQLALELAKGAYRRQKIRELGIDLEAFKDKGA